MIKYLNVSVALPDCLCIPRYVSAPAHSILVYLH